MFGFLGGDCPTPNWGGISFFWDKISILRELTGEEKRAKEHRSIKLTWAFSQTALQT